MPITTWKHVRAEVEYGRTPEDVDGDLDAIDHYAAEHLGQVVMYLVTHEQSEVTVPSSGSSTSNVGGSWIHVKVQYPDDTPQQIVAGPDLADE